MKSITLLLHPTHVMINKFVLLFCIYPFLSCYSQTSSDYYKRADLKYDQKNYQGAIEDFGKAIEVDPKFIKAYKKRGQSKAMLQNIPGAIEDWTKVIEINPRDSDTYVNLGTAKYLIQDYHGAIKDFDIAIAINPKDAYGYYGRAFLNIIYKIFRKQFRTSP